ncbi:sulfatase-like hydrolase/transferase [Paenibacillus koleovorans]|uniref:sulfatase-like hydrolase/transferase n=1 Tax=Paenibacillus koleovorans TaxID=121608 RepID=UPI001FE82219|nr:sulfatase-like hydrolase/transferase [Paenibacillus koleovorans]
MIMTDQQRWDTAGVYGNPLNLTPNFDYMAHYGTLLEHAFSCQPVCGPARACLQTGLYASTTGYIGNNAPFPQGTKTLAHYFRDAGYYTGLIGKWHVSDQEIVTEPQRGGYQYWLCHNKLSGKDCTPYKTMVYNTDHEPVHLPGYRADAIMDAALSFISQRRTEEQPFFLNINFIEPHQQTETDEYAPPDIYRTCYTGAWTPPDLASLGGNAHQNLGPYYGCVKRIDECLGRLLDVFKSLDMTDNSILVFTSDHGNHFYTRNYGCKRSLHDSSIRIPMALIGPGFNRRGKIREPITLLDVAPTLLDAANIPVPVELQGRSFLPLVRHEEIPWPEEAFIQISQTELGRAIRTEKWKYGVVASDKDPWLDPSSDTYEEVYLYNLISDPYELHNLAGYPSHAEISNSLRQRLIERMVEAGESAPVIHPAMVKDLPQFRYMKVY